MKNINIKLNEITLKKTFSVIIRIIKVKLIIKPREKRISKKVNKYDFLLNDGERYDPFIAGDLSHKTRYKFSKKFVNKQDKVLDIACGTGHGTYLLSKYCKKITGVDKSSTAINFAKKKYNKKNISFTTADFFSYDQKADIVLTFETLEHLKSENFKKILKKLMTLTNKIIIGSFPYKEVKGGNKFHYWFDLKETSLNYLKENGNLIFYYQLIGGKIYNKLEDYDSCQNLIFVYSKFQDKNDK